MFIGTLKVLFSISAILFSLLIILHKQYTLKVKDNVKISNYVAIIAFSLVLYILCAILLGVFFGGINYKILMFLFALTPFVIGQLAQYQKIKLFSSIQIMLMLLSTVIACAI